MPGVSVNREAQARQPNVARGQWRGIRKGPDPREANLQARSSFPTITRLILVDCAVYALVEIAQQMSPSEPDRT